MFQMRRALSIVSVSIIGVMALVALALAITTIASAGKASKYVLDTEARDLAINLLTGTGCPWTSGDKCVAELMTGPTTISSSLTTSNDETLAMPTEVLDMNLTGQLACGGPSRSLRITQNPNRVSPGQILPADSPVAQELCANAKPEGAEDARSFCSFFDIFVGADIDGVHLISQDAIRMTAYITSIPPLKSQGFIKGYEGSGWVAASDAGVPTAAVQELGRTPLALYYDSGGTAKHCADLAGHPNHTPVGSNCPRAINSFIVIFALSFVFMPQVLEKRVFWVVVLGVILIVIALFVWFLMADCLAGLGWLVALTVTLGLVSSWTIYTAVRETAHIQGD